MIKLVIALFTVLCVYGAGSVPSPYYVNHTWNDHSLEGMRELITGFNVSYQEGTFDCTEMTSYLDWFLKNHGFNTRICMDWSGPWLNNCHAWLGVKLEDDSVVYIESTGDPEPYIITYHDSLWDIYNLPEDLSNPLGMRQYKTIYAAMGDGVTESELDWWNIIGG